MPRSERIDWLAPTLTLCALWLLATGLFIAFNVMSKSLLPGFVAKAGPFIIAGFATGRLVSASKRSSRIIAAAVLAVVSAAAWTSFSFATTSLSPDRALVLFALSLPVNILGGAWAYFGMFLARRRSQPPTSANRAPIDPDLEDLEREIRASDRGDGLR
jgi:hypothetical protein